MTEALLIAVLIVGIANLALVILLIGGRRDAARDIDRLKRDMLDEQRALRAEVSENTRRSINAVGETLLNEYQRDTLNQEQRFKTFAMENAQRMEQIRRSVERQLADIREDNGKKLDEMRSIVDEKLQKTLEDKLYCELHALVCGLLHLCVHFVLFGRHHFAQYRPKLNFA